MKISAFLAAADVLIDFRATGKVGLLHDVSVRAAASFGLSAEFVLNELVKRDELGSTGIGGGVSVPHARLQEIAKPFGLLVRLKQPIEFDAVDGRPVDIVFVLLLPAASQSDQLNALAAVARKLRDAETVKSMRSATTATELYRAIAC